MAQFARLSPATILVVEHEALVRLELASALEELGFTVLEARDSDSAIATVDAHPEIELMITSLRMRGSMDGTQLAHHVRDRWPPIKVIVSSGALGIDVKDLPLGSLVLSKPYGPDALARAVTGLMDERPTNLR